MSTACITVAVDCVCTAALCFRQCELAARRMLAPLSGDSTSSASLWMAAAPLTTESSGSGEVNAAAILKVCIRSSVESSMTGGLLGSSLHALCGCIVAQAVDALYKEAESSNGGSALLHMFIAQFQSAYRNNVHMEIVHLTIAAVRAQHGELSAAVVVPLRPPCICLRVGSTALPTLLPLPALHRHTQPPSAPHFLCLMCCARTCDVTLPAETAHGDGCRVLRRAAQV